MSTLNIIQKMDQSCRKTFLRKKPLVWCKTHLQESPASFHLGMVRSLVFWRKLSYFVILS